MPLFYFDMRSPQGLSPDDTGLVLESAEVAYLEAYQAIPDLTAEIMRLGHTPIGYTFEVADEAGRVLWRIPFSEPFG